MKILKWILGLIAGLGGILALFAGNKSKEKVKEIKKDIKISKKKVKKIKKEISAVEETQENYKQTLKEMKKKKETYKAPEVSGDEADKFVKDFLKKRKNKK